MNAGAEKVGWAALALVLVLLASTGLDRGHTSTGDTQRLVTGSRLLVDCLRDGPRTGCARVPNTENETFVGTFPPLQYIPAIALEQVGLDDAQTIDGLVLVNLACLVVLAASAWVWARRDRSPWPPLLGVLLLTGPMLVYGTSGFGEMLAATVLVAFVVAVRFRRPVAIAVACLLATTSKETMAPFLVGLALLAGRNDDDGWLPPLRVLVPLVPGLILGTLATWALNLVRYESIWNERYLEPRFQADGLGRVAVNTLDVLVAPGGGLLPFWPTYALFLVSVVGAAVLAVRRRELIAATTRLAALGLFVVFAVGLGRWWAPFGWVAWGPRLLLPLLPAFALVSIWIGGADLRRIVTRALLHPVAVSVLALSAVAGAYVAASGGWFVQPAVEALHEADEGCPGPSAPDTAQYWSCFDHRAWRVQLNPIRVAAGRHDVAGTAARVAAIAGALALLVGARERAQALGQDHSRHAPAARGSTIDSAR